MHTLHRSIALLTLLAAPLASGAQPSSSQAVQPDLIPRELVLALLNYNVGGGGGTNIRVGKAPDDVPPELVPPGAQMIGSMTQFGSIILVLGFSPKPDSALGFMQAHLLADGWTRPLPQAARATPRGFVADFAGVNSGMPDVFCRGEEFVNLSATYRTSGGSLLRVNYNRSGRMSMCGESDRESMRSPYDDAPIPMLRAPAGSMSTGGGGMSVSGRTDYTLSTRLSTRLTPAELVGHYDSQMRDAGWTTVREGTVEFLSARTYRKTDEKERVWTAVLYAMSASDGAEKDVALRITRR